MQQIAVLRFENLSSDAAADWVGRGIAEGVATAIAPTAAEHALNTEELHRVGAALGKRVGSGPGVSYEWPEARAAFATRVISGSYVVNGSSVEVSAVEMDAATQKTRKVASVAGALGQVPRLAVELAKSLGYATQGAATLNENALRSYAMAVEAADASTAAGQYRAAVEADPAFGAAYLGWARLALAARDGATFESVMRLAAPHAAQFPPFYRASLAALNAEAHGDAGGRLAALRELARAAPADPLALRFLADAQLAAGNYGQGTQHYEQAAHDTPSDPDLRNLLVYAYLTQGNEGAARRECEAYARLADGANPVDTLGDVSFHFNHFEEAGKWYLEAYRRDPELDGGGSLEKAAVSALLAGDLPKANQIHLRYVQERAARRDPLAELRRADWLFLTGRRPEAMDAARQYAARAAAVPPLQSAALTRLAAWQLQSGASAEAAQNARAAMSLEKARGSNHPASLLEIFAEPLDDAAFGARLEVLYPGPANQERRLLAGAYRLLFRGEWDRALPAWKKLSENSNAQTERVIYAWLLLRSGHQAEAAKLAASTPLWHPNQEDLFSGVWFPKLLAVRAASGSTQDQRLFQAIGRE